MKLNILGTDYEYELTSDTKDASLCGCDGYCDAYSKRIAIEVDHNRIDPMQTKNIDDLVKKVIRHEITHGFIFESGMCELAENELVVDWFAWMAPKLFKTFQEMDAL